jgi:hypothetical protein
MGVPVVLLMHPSAKVRVWRCGSGASKGIDVTLGGCRGCDDDEVGGAVLLVVRPIEVWEMARL